MGWNRDRSQFNLRGSWDADSGAVIERAINALIDSSVTLGPNDSPYEHRLADAVTEMARISLAKDGTMRLGLR
jgi:hypothetical protein